MSVLERNELRFAFFPAGDENTASSRIRVFSTTRIFQSREIPFSIGETRDANILYIQKKVTSKILNEARKAKRKGHTVIYEIDDFGEALAYWVSPKLLRRMVRLADTIITATPEEAELLETLYGIKDPITLPPCVDYYPDQPARTTHDSNDPLRILWFGNSGTFPSFERYLKTLLGLPGVQVVVCMDEAGQELVSGYGVEFVLWDLRTFVGVLQSSHLTCLTHEETAIGRVKTNNKMITSITWGVPAMVTNTPDYLRTAQEAGVEYAVFSNEEQLKSIVDRLRSVESRRLYLDAAQPVIWTRQSPAAVADMILTITRQISPDPFLQRWYKVFASYL